MASDKFIIVSGSVILDNNQILVTKSNKDDFYKLPGGIIKKDENPEQKCIERTYEETNTKIKPTKSLHPEILYENPQTKEKMTIVLLSYKAKIENREEAKPMGSTTEIKWLDLDKIKEWENTVSPYIQFLIEKGDIK
ncbi:NUDIX hydrolase [Methanococcoides sp. SA1]|nr:NUDIX hydrolase [Methanococcoides sp. SA1]